MKKTILITLCFVVPVLLIQAQDIKIIYENSSNGNFVFASNPEIYPVSLKLDFKLTNLSFSSAADKIFVLPPKSEKIKIGELSVVKSGKKYNSSYTSKFWMGDLTHSNYDKSVVYDLPFQKDKSYNVFQGYDGAFSHQNENALDFTMPIGTEILAAREGLVVQVVDNNTEACPKPNCKQYNNYITVMHADGTFAHYAHLKYKGAKKQIGETVSRGEILALSGNTGFTSGPHLHFVCFLPGFDGWNTIATKFKTGTGDTVEALEEKKTYERLY